MKLKIVLDFLIDLQTNNNRNWFKENNDRYQSAKKEFEEFVETIIPEIKKFDDSIDVNFAKECVFRIFRDVRFSKNKNPYKENFGAFIAKGGRKTSHAGYYIHIQPDSSFIGGGIYMPESPILNSIRTEVLENTHEFKNLIGDQSFKKQFKELYGEKLKSAPRGFPKDFADIELLKYKHYVVSKNVKNSFWNSKNVVDQTIEIFKTQYEFNQFLNRAVDKLN